MEGRVLPGIGNRIAKNSKEAYAYLPASVSQFPSGQAMADLMKQITEIPEYAEDLKKFKQPVAYFGTEDAKAILAKTRDDFMQFKDELRKAK